MVEDLLEQLSATITPTEGGVKDVLRKKGKTVKKLELRLTDRRKLSNDGYARVPFFWPHLRSRARRASGTRTLFFPRGMGASIMPFGRDHWISALTPN
jgi:hypothetical protein